MPPAVGAGQSYDRCLLKMKLEPSRAILFDNPLFYCPRIRLSASPATGLVGMQENGFLSDFFGCIGFLPLATQR